MKGRTEHRLMERRKRKRRRIRTKIKRRPEQPQPERFSTERQSEPMSQALRHKSKTILSLIKLSPHFTDTPRMEPMELAEMQVQILHLCVISLASLSSRIKTLARTRACQTTK